MQILTRTSSDQRIGRSAHTGRLQPSARTTFTDLASKWAVQAENEEQKGRAA
jgi:hypothetical protein